MRSLAFWLSGAILAFAITVGAFLLLANLAGRLQEERSLLPRERSAERGPSLGLNLDEDQLETLERSPDQQLTLSVVNGGEENISDVNLTIEVASENTALPDIRYYQATVENLAAGESTTVDFNVNLSPSAGATNPEGSPDPPRKILEVRATTPEGLSAVRTAILPF